VTRKRTRNLQRKATVAKAAKVDVAIRDGCAEKLPQGAIGIRLLSGQREGIFLVFLCLHRIPLRSINSLASLRYQVSTSLSDPPMVLWRRSGSGPRADHIQDPIAQVMAPHKLHTGL
jgi:hypothetical protein